MRAWILIIVAVVACKKDTGGGDSHRGEPASTAEADALWKLAPEGAIVGVVVSPRAMQMTEHAWQDIHTFIATSPELEPVAAELEQALRTLPSGPDVSLASFGLSAQKGAAIFFTGPNDGIVVVPLGDRDKFLAAVHGAKG